MLALLKRALLALILSLTLAAQVEMLLQYPSTCSRGKGRSRSKSRCRERSASVLMRDGSTAENYFRLGDNVRVIAGPRHQLSSLSLSFPSSSSIKLPEFDKTFSSVGFVGVVHEVWEKCDVDPHCCCAELAFDAPIRVMFNVSLVSCNEYGAIGAATVHWSAQFAVDELEKTAAPQLSAEGGRLVGERAGVESGAGKRKALQNEVRFEIDEDVTYLGKYVDSKY